MDYTAMASTSVDEVLAEFNLFDRGNDILCLVRQKPIGNIRFIHGKTLVIHGICSCEAHHAFVENERQKAGKVKARSGNTSKCQVFGKASANLWGTYRAMCRWLLMTDDTTGADHRAAWKDMAPQPGAAASASSAGV